MRDDSIKTLLDDKESWRHLLFPRGFLLTDYFHSGKCIFAVGPENIAPMEYLAAEEAAICAHTENEIYQQLKSISERPQMIHQFAENAYLCGRRNHSRPAIQKTVEQTFIKILKNKS